MHLNLTYWNIIANLETQQYFSFKEIKASAIVLFQSVIQNSSS